MNGFWHAVRKVFAVCVVLFVSLKIAPKCCSIFVVSYTHWRKMSSFDAIPTFQAWKYDINRVSSFSYASKTCLKRRLWFSWWWSLVQIDKNGNEKEFKTDIKSMRVRIYTLFNPKFEMGNEITHAYKHTKAWCKHDTIKLHASHNVNCYLSLVSVKNNFTCSRLRSATPHHIECEHTQKQWQRNVEAKMR